MANRKEMGMGFDYGDGSLSDKIVCFKRKYRWMFYIPDVCGEGAPLLPPSKSARPSLSFKEMDAQHITETIYYPSKPEWKPINITLYDIVKRKNPVIEWIKKVYDVSETNVKWKAGSGIKIGTCRIELYDGVGEVIETWKLENAWPNNIEFGDLDYGSSDILSVDLTLRYDRAYII